MKPILYIFSGLPGVGKTTIAKKFAKIKKVPYFRIDTIEHGLKEICLIDVQGEGYRLTYRIVEDNLKIGNDVVVDCCNPWELTRAEWEEVAINNHSHFINIEIICSDKREHKERIESRDIDIKGFNFLSWEEVEKRNYHPWIKERIVIETSKKEKQQCLQELLDKIENFIKKFPPEYFQGEMR